MLIVQKLVRTNHREHWKLLAGPSVQQLRSKPCKSSGPENATSILLAGLPLLPTKHSFASWTTKTPREKSKSRPFISTSLYHSTTTHPFCPIPQNWVSQQKNATAARGPLADLKRVELWSWVTIFWRPQKSPEATRKTRSAFQEQKTKEKNVYQKQKTNKKTTWKKSLTIIMIIL